MYQTTERKVIIRVVGTSIRQDDSILRTIIPLQDLPCTGGEEMGNPTEVVLRSKVLIPSNFCIK